jgi:hypothetical protein
MKKSRFIEEQFVAILAEEDRGEGTTGDFCLQGCGGKAVPPVVVSLRG